MVVLGSREQLCIHDKVSLLRGKTQTNACHLRCRKRGKLHCAHYSQVAGKCSALSTCLSIRSYIYIHN